MPVIENLRNFIRGGGDKDHHHDGHGHGHRHREGGNNNTTSTSTSSPTASSSQQQQSSPKSKQAAGKQGTGGMYVAPTGQHFVAAPGSAQQANYTAFAPEPHTRSEASNFPTANPAAVAHMGGTMASGGGGGGGVGVSGGARSKQEEAERIVRAENEKKAKAAAAAAGIYDGLPDQFELGEKMGDGAFSNVYKALDRRTGKKVAIKCVRKYELNHNQDGGKHLNAAVKKKPRATERANILKEVQIMRGLQHDSIVELLSFTESRDHYFLVLELMEGGELFHQIVKLTYFSEEVSRHVIKQVAEGIRYLHEVKGVVHRDIKPENLLFEAIPIIPSKNPKARPYDEEKEDEGEFIPGLGGGGIGTVKIADFGLSKIVWNEETMTPCGTVGYTAPEIVKDERYSKSVDMWALGCVLYTLLSGFPPFYDESINVLTEKVARGYYTFLSPWWDDISASSKDLITHLLCVDPDKRYTIDEFLAHPWMNEKPPQPNLDKAALATLAPAMAAANKYAPLDSPLLVSKAGREIGRSPGAATLKEMFDVTYAVHRMEEEGARRRAYNGPGGAGQRGFLQGLNEEDEEEEQQQHAVIQQRQQQQAQAQAAQQQQQQQQRGAQQQAAAASAAQKGRQQPPQQQQQQYQGWGGADRKMAEAVLYDGRAGTRDRGNKHGKRGGGFELNMDAATLLGRRKHPVDVAAAVGAQQKAGASPSVGVPMDISSVPTSPQPMTVD